MQRGQPEWIKWRMCTRKVRYAEKPRNTETMESYHCPHCGAYHRTTRKKKLKINRPVPRTIVTRGGYELEK